MKIPKDKFVKITSLEKSEPVAVYDLEVEEDHEFYANGFLVHNCLGNYHPHGDKACLSGNTLVPLLFESTKTIAGLAKETQLLGTKNPKEVIAYCPYTETFVRATAHSWRQTKVVDEIIQVFLFSGEHISCTSDHEILTNAGWKEAGNLQAGDTIVGGTLMYGKDSHLLTQQLTKLLMQEFASPSDKSLIFLGTDYGLQKTKSFDAATNNSVVCIETQKLDIPMPVYDFTVDGYENMIVFSSHGLNSGNFCVVHNCYDAIVNAVVNQNIAMVHGEGNFGTMTEDPAAMRYCFTEDAKVFVKTEKGFFEFSFKELAMNFGVYQNAGAEELAQLTVLSKDGEDVSSHIVCSGIQDTVQVTTVDGISVRCTPNEPFYVYDSQNNTFSWVDASDLVQSNLVVMAKLNSVGGHIYEICAIHSVEQKEPDYVYDLCVPKSHSFTANGFVVHNTNLKLSKYSDLVFFDKFYMPTVEYVPNYDGSRKEPLVLPALLPNAVLNGNFGIAPGVNTRSPMFLLSSVAKVLQKMLAGDGKCSPEMCNTLEFTTASGGKAHRTKANKPDFDNFFATGKGRVTFVSTSTAVDKKTNSIRFDRFAPISDMEKVMTKIESIKGVQSTRDDSDENDPFKTAFVISFTKNTKDAALESVVQQVHDVLTSNYTFDVKVTDRVIKENGQAAARLRATTIPKMLEEWLEYRIQIEIGACQYWQKEAEKRIEYLDLMRIAISNIDIIIKHLKNKKLDDTKLQKAIGKDLKISDEKVNLILARNLRQLRHLEDQKLLASIKELKQEIKVYGSRIKKPKEYISSNIAEIVAKLKI